MSYSFDHGLSELPRGGRSKEATSHTTASIFFSFSSDDEFLGGNSHPRVRTDIGLWK